MLRCSWLAFLLLALLLSAGCQPVYAPDTALSASTTPTMNTTHPPVTAVSTTYELTRDVPYGEGGGHLLYLDIYRPLQPIATPTPAVVFVHGGGWSQGDKYPSKVTLLARAGFFCVSINYRLSGEARFPAAVEDAKCAVRWLRANAARYGVDPDAIGAWGSSAGGHLVLMLGCADGSAGLEGSGGWAGVSSRVQAVCDYFGPADLSTAFGDTAVPAFLGASLAADPDLYRRASPISYVSADDPPLLMVHGDKDTVVPLGQSQRMLAACQAQGLTARLIVVHNAGHGFNQMGKEPVSPPPAEYEQAVLDFFVAYLANAPR